MISPVSRFAPSPTGMLHLGHAASALTVWNTMQDINGQVFLRLEDIDQTRCRPEYETAILEDLEWLGFTWPEPARRQSDHFDDYSQALNSLIERGLCYRCFRTRKEILADIGRAPHDAPQAFVSAPLPPAEEAEKLDRKLPFAWRLNLREARAALGSQWQDLSYTAQQGANTLSVAVDPALHGDVVLARKDSPTSYHLATTHDDALQGVTHIIRGVDLEASTHVHVLIQTLMGWPTPVYTHHRLLTGPDGKRFAKRDKSQTLASLRSAGLSPEQVRKMAALT